MARIEAGQCQGARRRGKSTTQPKGEGDDRQRIAGARGTTVCRRVQARAPDATGRAAREIHFEPNQVIFREGDDTSILYLLVEGMVALELEVPEHLLRVQTLYAGDVFDWSAVLPHAGKHFQARALDSVTTLAFEGDDLLASFRSDPEFGLAFMLRLMGVVSERLRATRLQLLDMYSPVAKRAGA